MAEVAATSASTSVSASASPLASTFAWAGACTTGPKCSTNIVLVRADSRNSPNFTATAIDTTITSPYLSLYFLK